MRVSGPEWEQTCKFGEAHDAGQEFEIAVIAVDATVDARLRRWFENAAQGNYHPLVQLPDSVRSCRPVVRRVVRP